MVKIIADPGSTHMGNLKQAKQLVKIAKDADCDAVKFQLFKTEHVESENIPLPYEWMSDLCEAGELLGIEVFASVWDQEGIDKLLECECKSIKLAYSQAHKTYALGEFTNVYKSFGVMNRQPKEYESDNVKHLYCIPEYPVKYMIDFEWIFVRFDGFSDHTLGYQQTIRAVEAGAKIIEKHFRPYGANVYKTPDGTFALDASLLSRMVKKVRACES